MFLRTLRPRMDVAFHLSSPFEKAPQLPPLAPQEFPKLQEPNLRHLYASVGFNAPKQIRTSPGCQPVSLRGIPQKPDLVAHADIITRKPAKIHERKQAGTYPAFKGEVRARSHARIRIPPGTFSMPDDNARQKAEDHYYAALDLMADGKLEEAVAAYRESLIADPQFTEAMHGLARALQDLERYDEAISVAKQIAEVDPDDVLAHTSLSVLYQKKGMIPEAEAEGAKARVLGWKQQLKKGSS